MSDSEQPGPGFTAATISSTRDGSALGTPKTTQCRTPGQASSASSTWLGATLRPATLIDSDSRPLSVKSLPLMEARSAD
jgi:hypothetical protein